MICEKCEKDRLAVAPFFSTGSPTVMICPICALEATNKLHGLPPGTPFGGEIAQEMYEAEIEFERG